MTTACDRALNLIPLHLNHVFYSVASILLAPHTNIDQLLGSPKFGLSSTTLARSLAYAAESLTRHRSFWSLSLVCSS